MKHIVVVLALLLITIVAQANDCFVTAAVLTPYAHSRSATRAEWRHSREAVESLMMRCSSGPDNAHGRAIFYQFVEHEFTYTYVPRFEGESESVSQFQHELQQYMGKIVTPDDLSFKPMILRFGNAKSIAALGPAVRRDVMTLAREETQAVGYSRSSPQQHAIGAIGYWLDPAESRFTSAEKEEMTQLLLDKIRDTPGRAVVGDPYATAYRAIEALSHADSPEVAAALRAVADDSRSTLRDIAKSSYHAVKARLQSNH